MSTYPPGARGPSPGPNQAYGGRGSPAPAVPGGRLSPGPAVAYGDRRPSPAPGYGAAPAHVPYVPPSDEDAYGGIS